MKTIEWNGRTYECPYAEALSPLDALERQGLRQQIIEDGVRDAILLDIDGRVIDGVNRLELAAELGLEEVPMLTLNLHGEAAREKALKVNLGRRNLTPLDKTKHWADLREAGMSLRQIAAKEGVSHTAVRRALVPVQLEQHVPTEQNSTPLKVATTDGKSYPAERVSEPVIEARRELAQELKAEGKPVREIARELGVSVGTVSSDLKAVPTFAPPTSEEIREIAAKQAAKAAAPVISIDTKAPAAPAVAAAKPEFITLDDYQKMSPDGQRAALEVCPSSKVLNRQDTTSIEWAQFSWNPITGCRHDCPYCYARDIAGRFYKQGFEPSIYPERFAAPANTGVPAKAEENTAFKNVFTCSMADLWGRWVPAEWIQAVLDIVRAHPQWNFLFLTKFPRRMSEFDIPENAWVGTSVDCQIRVKNAEQAFEKVNASVKWLSIEPMLEPLKFEKLDLFQWVVIGGASPSNNTPEWIPPFDWIASMHTQARSAGCRIYYKTNCGMPDSLRIREFPWEDPTPQKILPDVFRYLGQAKTPNQAPEGDR